MLGTRWRLPAVVGLLLTLVVGLGLLAGCGSTAPPAATGGPRIQVDPASVDFGKVPLNQPAERTFTVRNTGDAPLTLQKEAKVTLLEGC